MLPASGTKLHALSTSEVPGGRFPMHGHHVSALGWTETSPCRFPHPRTPNSSLLLALSRHQTPEPHTCMLASSHAVAAATMLSDIHLTRTAFLFALPFLLYISLPASLILPVLRTLRNLAAFTIFLIWWTKALCPPTWLYHSSYNNRQQTPRDPDPWRRLAA